MVVLEGLDNLAFFAKLSHKRRVVVMRLDCIRRRAVWTTQGKKKGLGGWGVEVGVSMQYSTRAWSAKSTEGPACHNISTPCES